MTFLDRVIAQVAPTTALRRVQARAALGVVQRSYDAAKHGRRTDGWRAGSTAADTEIEAAGSVLRDRMRDLVRNNPLAARAVEALASNLVGTGIRPRAATGDEGLDREVDNLWRVWSQECDAHGHTDFHGVCALAVREMIEGGDVFAVRRRLRRRDGTVPLRIELREADHLDSHRSSVEPVRAQGNVVKYGIEYDAAGRRVAYWMYPDHPGDWAPSFSRLLTSQRVPASMVAHLFERQRTQSRGVPWGVPAMRHMRDLDDWDHAELTRKKTEACLVGIVVGADEDQMGIAPTVIDAEGNAVEEFAPGMIAHARGAKSVEFNSPSATPQVSEWNRVQLQKIAAGWRLPYELLTGDLSQVNFSSSRVGLNEFRRLIRRTQHHVVIPQFCQPIWDWFTEAAWVAGLLPRPDIAVKWQPPAFESVNPLQDAQTDLLEVRAGFASPQEIVGRRGRDHADLIAEWAAAKQAQDGLGLVFDHDPSLVGKSGTAQSVTPGDPQGER